MGLAQPDLSNDVHRASAWLLLGAPVALALLVGYLAGLHGIALVVAVLAVVAAAAGWALQKRVRATETVSGVAADHDASAQLSDPVEAPVAGPYQSAPSAPAFDWRTIVDLLPDAAVVTGAGGTILHFNPILADHYQRARRGAAIVSVIRSPELVDVLSQLGPGEGAQTITLEERVPIRRRWSATATALPMSADGDDVGHLIVLRDMTEQERHARQRADFIAYASHELRTPLATLKSMTETLLGPARNDEAARDRFLGMMSTQAD
ncbi:MAG: histidine kinase dimerization/phospho-acceptor domain-containing protein, partial [Pseudomonadota bacterium]